MGFVEKWLAAVDKKNSILCAGLDPAEFEMGRGDEGLRERVMKRSWAMAYLEAVAPYCAAVKPNINYWKAGSDMETLDMIAKFAWDHGMIVIDDSKLADIGPTNDAGMYHSSRRADAVTVAPFAGNIAEIARQAQARGLAAICMCLMSNPDYAREKNKLVPLTPEEVGLFDLADIISADSDGRQSAVPHVKQYQWLACQSKQSGLAGLVIGAPSKKNHITDSEVERAFYYSGSPGSNMLALYPGLGKQEGEMAPIFSRFPGNMVIANVGRYLMFPKGIESTTADQAEAAKHYRDALNVAREAA